MEQKPKRPLLKKKRKEKNLHLKPLESKSPSNVPTPPKKKTFQLLQELVSDGGPNHCKSAVLSLKLVGFTWHCTIHSSLVASSLDHVLT
jgi:hypothetical protein